MTTTTNTPGHGSGVREARIRLGAFGRKRFEITNCTDTEAVRREEKMREVARNMVAAGLAADAIPILKRMGTTVDADHFRGAMRLAEGLCSGRVPKPKNAASALTFAKIGSKWTGGELHRDYPDHVKAKDHDDDASRLGYLCELDVGGVKLGELPIDRVTLDHCESAMRQLPESARRPATRRHYAQVIHRVLALAVYPLRLIAASPLPRGFMPKTTKSKAFSYLYPTDDAALLGCADVAFNDRVFFGFLDREGPRAGEAASLPIAAFDLERGAVRLDENKTDDPRAWALDPGVVRALRAYVKRCRVGAEPTALMFVDADGAAYDVSKLADRLRAALRKANVHEARPELFDSTDARSRLRAHDLRGTFVTLSLANGKTETWVADRTGHRSSAMINRYRRAARSANELRLGPLAPLDLAIPELRTLSGGPGSGPRRERASRRARRNELDSQNKAEVAEWQTRRIQNPLP